MTIFTPASISTKQQSDRFASLGLLAAIRVELLKPADLRTLQRLPTGIYAPNNQPSDIPPAA